MGALAQLSTSELDVEPGRSASLVITVRNTGTVVDRFTFEPVGSAAGWVTFTPDTLSLFPEASGTVTAVFAPPRLPTTTAGRTPFAIRVASAEDPAGSVVEEGTIDVGAFSDITVELVPRVARGRRLARTQLAVDNRSNCVYRAEFEGSDAQSALEIGFRPPMVDAGPGEAAFAKLLIKPKRTFWRGPAKTQPFRVTLRTVAPVMPLPPTAPPVPAPPGTSPPPTTLGAPTPLGGLPGPAGPSGLPGPAGLGGPAGAPPPPPGPGVGSASGLAAGATPTSRVAAVPGPPPNPHPDEVGADGSMMQESLLPSWFFKALAALAALAILFVILWFTLFKPQIKSTAQNEVNKGLVSNGLAPLTGNPSGGGSQKSGGGGGGGGSSSGGSTSTTAPSIATGTSSSGTGSATRSLSLNGSIQATANGTRVVYSVPTGASLQVTDLLVENSAGNTGTLSIARNGGVIMQWAMANFRDLDYHWITPVLFSSGSQMQLIISGCNSPCSPGIYYAGTLQRAGA